MSDPNVHSDGVADGVAAAIKKITGQAPGEEMAELLSLEERMAHAREQGLLVEPADVNLLMKELGAPLLRVYRICGTLAEGMLMPTLEMRMRLVAAAELSRQIQQTIDASLRYCYGIGGMEDLREELGANAAGLAALRREVCSCGECMTARAAGRLTLGHPGD